jgi:hypothetical protein
MHHPFEICSMIAREEGHVATWLTGSPWGNSVGSTLPSVLQRNYRCTREFWLKCRAATLSEAVTPFFGRLDNASMNDSPY